MFGQLYGTPASKEALTGDYRPVWALLQLQLDRCTFVLGVQPDYHSLLMLQSKGRHTSPATEANRVRLSKLPGWKGLRKSTCTATCMVVTESCTSASNS